MFALPVMAVLTAVFTVIQVSIWSMFPIKLKDIIFANPVLAFLINLAGSNFIVAFTGVASMVGACNLCASVVFGLYAAIYKKKKGIDGLTVGWAKLFRIIPLVPKIDVVYGGSSHINKSQKTYAT
jgi:hypothetical protein